MTIKTQKLLAGGGLLTASVIWGFAFVVVKNALDFIPVLYMLSIRFTIAGVALALIFFKKTKSLDRTRLKQGAVMGVLLFLAYVTQTVGCRYTTAGKNAFLTTVYVVLVPLLHWLLWGKKPGKQCLGAAFLALAGIGLLSLNNDLSINKGDLLTLLCGVCYAVHILFIDRFSENSDPIQLTMVQFFVAAALGWIFAPFFSGPIPAGMFSRAGIEALLYLGLFSTLLGFTLQSVCQRITAPSTAALLLSFESVFGALFSAVFLHESMTGRMLLGCGCLFAAVLLSQIRFQKPRRLSGKRAFKEADI